MIKTIGKSLTKARKAKHLTQEQLSEISGISLSQISRIECDKSSPTVQTLLTLCDVLDVGLDEVLHDYLPSNMAASNSNIRHVISIMESMDDKHNKCIENLIAAYHASYPE